MPRLASSLDDVEFLRLMCEAPAKVGKTRSIGQSLIALAGPGYIIECGTETSVTPLKRVTKKFEYDMVRSEGDMDDAIKSLRLGVKEKRYHWVLLDDFNYYAGMLQEYLENESRNQKGEPDGRKFWPEYHKRLRNILMRIMDVKCHFVMTCHAGAFMGKSANEIPGQFTDVVTMEYVDEKEGRVFKINESDSPGRACRSVDGQHTIPADCQAFWKLITKKPDPKTTGR